MIIKIDDNTYIHYNPQTQTSVTIKVDELTNRKGILEAELAEFNDLSDAKLLAWAKANYGNQENFSRKQRLEKELEIVEGRLNLIQ